MELVNNLLCFSNKETINKFMSVKNCILEYVKRKTKTTLQIFFIWHLKLEKYVDYYQK